MVSNNSNISLSWRNLTIEQRLKHLKTALALSDSDLQHINKDSSLPVSLLETFIENALGSFPLPLGLATNFLINDEDYLLPFAVEESSVIAAASYGAKLARSGGGFKTSSTDPIMTGEVQIRFSDSLPKKAFQEYLNKLEKKNSDILKIIDQTHPNLVKRGGGARKVWSKYISDIHSIILYLNIDVRDAMGANIVNTACEKVGKFIAALFKDACLGLKILTNLTEFRMAKAFCSIPISSLATELLTGEEVATNIEHAYLFAKYDIYRAATHNKGIMNGIDPLVISTGNDWRAVEAGAHSYAARKGHYEPLSMWKRNVSGYLEGSLELPLAVGVVGGVTKLHPTAQTVLKILKNPSAQKLSEIICAAGLAQNLSALKSLATDGIQKGHMRLHQKNLDLLKKK